MALSLTTQWTLVASGLMAHADHVISGEECERLMTLVDEEADGDAYAKWLTIVSDPARLQAMLGELTPPPVDTHRQILEDAWLMAVVDGERVDAEHEALERIADRLGVEMLQLEHWREAWTTAQQAYAQAATAALVHVLGGGEAVSGDDDDVVERFVHQLPTTHDHRAELIAEVGATPSAYEEVDRQVRALGKPQRRDLVRRLAAVSEDAAQAEQAGKRWRALGRELGLTDDELAEISGG